MTRIKPKAEKPTWQKTAAEILRYGFFIFYLICLAGMIAGARWISNFSKNSNQKLDQEMQQRLMLREEQRAEEARAALLQAEKAAAEMKEAEIVSQPPSAGVENAPA